MPSCLAGNEVLPGLKNQTAIELMTSEYFRVIGLFYYIGKRVLLYF